MVDDIEVNKVRAFDPKMEIILARLNEEVGEFREGAYLIIYQIVFLPFFTRFRREEIAVVMLWYLKHRPRYFGIAHADG